jgi:hypothetical protein
VITLLAAERNNYGSNERVQLRVNDEVISTMNPSNSFSRFEHFFTPDSNGAAEIVFQNTSPHLTPKDGHSIFLDDVSISIPRECGDNAGCSLPDDGSDGYVCQCLGKGFVGHDAMNKPADCIDVTTYGSKAEVLAEKMDIVQEKVVSLETGVKALVQQGGAMQTSLNENAATVEALQATSDQLFAMDAKLSDDATATATTIEGLRTDVAALQSGMAVIQVQLDGALAANDKLVAALVAATFSVPSVATDPRADDTFNAEINADGLGGLDFVIQQDKHATVNGKPLLTAEEVQAMIQGAVAEALKNIADAV